MSGPPSLNNNAFVVAGPTGSGKTAFAADLCRRIGGEVVCADAFQVYRGLRVLTAQPRESLCREIPHHLYGMRDPAEVFDAASYALLAHGVMAEIGSRSRLPVLVGGAGFYLKAVFQGFDPVPPVDPALRAEIAVMPPSAALARLAALDPGAIDLLDARNPRRVARALEIVIQTGRPLADSRSGGGGRLSLRGVLLTRDPADLRERITKNVAALLESGAIDEVAALQDAGPTARRAIGFREIESYIAGRLTLEETRAAIASATRRYARRQLTWFRNQTNLPSLMLSAPSSYELALEEAAALALR